MEENNNAMDFFKRIKYAIFKVEKYGEFLEEKPSVSIKYMFTLLLIVSLIITIITTLGLISLIKQGESYIKTELNDFSFENNKLYFNGNQEAYDAKTDFTFVANTTEISNEQLSEYKNKAYDSEYAIILLNNKILLKVNDSLNEFLYEEINKDNQISTLNKADLIKFIDANGSTKIGMSIFGIVGISSYLAEIASVAMNIILLFVFGFLMCKIVSVPLKSYSIFNISIYSITLSVLLGFIYTVTNYYTGLTIQYFDSVYLVIAYIYLISAILIIKSDLIKQKIELEKIKDVQKDVAKEIEEQKEKDENKEEKKQENDDKKSDKENKTPEEQENTEPDGSEI